MPSLPTSRVLVYAAFALIVLLAGGWSLAKAGRAADSAGSREADAALVVTLPGQVMGSGADGEGAQEGVGGIQSGFASTTTTSGPPIVVHVTGAVVRPGVYSLEPGARVFEAVAAAGGPIPEADEQSLSLATPLTDGAQVVVPAEGEAGGVNLGGGGGAVAGGVGGAAGGSGAGGGAMISLNTATAAELEELPGVGPKTAEQIVGSRDAEGPFASLEDLERVPGIGPKTIERFRGLAQP